MGFDGFLAPQGVSSSDRPIAQAAPERAAINPIGMTPLIPMGASLGAPQGIDGVAQFNQAPMPALDRELAKLEALRRSQAELQRKSGRFQGASPEAQYLFAMAETLVKEDIPKREQNINNIFAAGFTPHPDSKARSLI